MMPPRVARSNAFLWAVATACLAVALSGCDRPGVEERSVPKGVERVPEAPAPETAGEAAPTAAGEGRPWTAPDGWTEHAEPRPMRLATYLAPVAGGPVEVAVTRFGGRVGGELANVNRWRGQMGLGPIGEGELDAAIARFSAPGYEGYEARIESPQGVMLAAGVYEESTDQTWFVRATVPDAETADRLQTDLFRMARSIAGVGG